MRDFLNFGIICQIVSLDIALFCIYSIMINKFQKIYENNKSKIGISYEFNLDIVY